MFPLREIAIRRQVEEPPSEGKAYHDNGAPFFVVSPISCLSVVVEVHHIFFSGRKCIFQPHFILQIFIYFVVIKQCDLFF